MRKFLAVIMALGLLAAAAPIQASAETTANPAKTTIVPKSKTKIANKKFGKLHYAKRAHHKTHVARHAHHKMRLAQHHRRHQLAMKKSHHHARLHHKQLLHTAQQANAR
jgi:hypothetical protein